MIYTIEKAELVAEQIRRFTSGYSHHVAGQFANIDFWLDEVIAAQRGIDEYTNRFYKLRDEQKKWVTSHGTVQHDFCPYCQGRCEFADGVPRAPVRTAHSELKTTRKKLTDNAYYFLIRCHRVGLLTLPELKAKCATIGTSVEPSDLDK